MQTTVESEEFAWKRGAGILLHITSLPTPYGIGDLGGAAYDFVDFLAEAGACWWQILPVTPTSSFMGSSPYSGLSLYAGNPLLISPELLLKRGLVRLADVIGDAPETSARVDYGRVEGYKMSMLRRAVSRNAGRLERDADFAAFMQAHDVDWLHDYALFTVIKEQHGGIAWNDWPEPLKFRDEKALQDFADKHAEAMLREKCIQFLFYEQWMHLKAYCAEKGVGIIGDLPIYPTYDSADVWITPEVFKLDKDGRSKKVAGVPPDYFSETGQRWGNPVYDWNTLQKQNYTWWIKRLAHNLLLYDVVRLDHFRGFAAYWEVPEEEKTAMNGAWVTAPGMEFFAEVKKAFPAMPFIAEDLGYITEDVVALRDAYDLPGMHVLSFSFGEDVAESAHALHMHRANGVVYTGTHDNNTTRGWFTGDINAAVKSRMERYLGKAVLENGAVWDLMRLACMSTCHTAVFPMQDVLNLGSEARMNTPSTVNGNWGWRLSEGAYDKKDAHKLRELLTFFGRCTA